MSGPRARGARRWGRGGGFTLVELLVGMVLLGAIMLALGSALRTFAQTETRIGQRIVRDDDYRATVAFLRTVLGRVSVRKPVVVPGESPRLMFRGAPAAMEWLGVMPVRQGMGGLHYFRLEVEPDGQGRRALVLRFQPFVSNDRPPVWDEALSRVLVPGVTAFALRYRDGASPDLAWGDAWTETARPPDRLTLSLAVDGEAWPELAVPLRPLDASNGGFVIGGGR